MRQANRAVFANLEQFCSRRSEPVSTPGLRRFIRMREGAEREADRNHLQLAQVSNLLRFGTDRALARVSFRDQHFIGLVGFDFEPDVPPLTVEANTPGLTILLLAASGPRPNASPGEIRNIVEAGSMDDDDADTYRGHRAIDIESLFPPIRVLRSPSPMNDEITSRLFLMICAGECANGGSWIEDSLAQELESLTRLEVPSLPYSAICESIFDADPRSLFMALYRCIEATYAYETSQGLVDDLGLGIGWLEMAQSLSSVLGWRPQESSSLVVALKNALDQDLQDLCACLNVQVGNNLRASAGKALYSLRNRVVHYRPGTERVELKTDEWNELCHILVRITFHVFSKAYA